MKTNRANLTQKHLERAVDSAYAIFDKYERASNETIANDRYMSYMRKADEVRAIASALGMKCPALPIG